MKSIESLDEIDFKVSIIQFEVELQLVSINKNISKWTIVLSC